MQITACHFDRGHIFTIIIIIITTSPSSLAIRRAINATVDHFRPAHYNQLSLPHTHDRDTINGHPPTQLTHSTLVHFRLSMSSLSTPHSLVIYYGFVSPLIIITPTTDQLYTAKSIKSIAAGWLDKQSLGEHHHSIKIHMCPSVPLSLHPSIHQSINHYYPVEPLKPLLGWCCPASPSPHCPPPPPAMSMCLFCMFNTIIIPRKHMLLCNEIASFHCVDFYMVSSSSSSVACSIVVTVTHCTSLCEYIIISLIVRTGSFVLSFLLLSYADIKPLIN